MKKNIIKNIFFALVALFSLAACEDRELITIDNQSNPILLDFSAERVVLDKNFPNNPAFTVSWKAASYTVPTEIRYKIEVSATENFATKYVLGNVAESIRTATFTAEQMNKAAEAIGLAPNVSARMYIRVSAFVGATSQNLIAESNKTYVMVTPYVLEFPNFYIVGAASYLGWDSSKAQLFYKSGSQSIMYTYLENNAAFRFLGQQDWNPINYSMDRDGTRANYRYFKQLSSNLEQDGDENMKFTGATGIYKVVINAATGVQSLNVTPASITNFDFPNMYLVGSVNGWDAANATAMTKVAAGVYELTLNLPNDAEFKFIGQRSWGDLEWGNIALDTTGRSGYLAPRGDNGNIKFAGGGNSYKVTVNIKAGIYSIVRQ